MRFFFEIGRLILFRIVIVNHALVFAFIGSQFKNATRMLIGLAFGFNVKTKKNEITIFILFMHKTFSLKASDKAEKVNPTLARKKVKVKGRKK